MEEMFNHRDRPDEDESSQLNKNTGVKRDDFGRNDFGYPEFFSAYQDGKVLNSLKSVLSTYQNLSKSDRREIDRIVEELSFARMIDQVHSKMSPLVVGEVQIALELGKDLALIQRTWEKFKKLPANTKLIAADLLLAEAFSVCDLSSSAFIGYLVFYRKFCSLEVSQFVKDRAEEKLDELLIRTHSSFTPFENLGYLAGFLSCDYLNAPAVQDDLITTFEYSLKYLLGYADLSKVLNDSIFTAFQKTSTTSSIFKNDEIAQALLLVLMQNFEQGSFYDMSDQVLSSVISNIHTLFKFCDCQYLLNNDDFIDQVTAAIERSVLDGKYSKASNFMRLLPRAEQDLGQFSEEAKEAFSRSLRLTAQDLLIQNLNYGPEVSIINLSLLVGQILTSKDLNTLDFYSAARERVATICNYSRLAQPEMLPNLVFELAILVKLIPEQQVNEMSKNQLLNSQLKAFFERSYENLLEDILSPGSEVTEVLLLNAASILKRRELTCKRLSLLSKSFEINSLTEIANYTLDLILRDQQSINYILEQQYKKSIIFFEPSNEYKVIDFELFYNALNEIALAIEAKDQGKVNKLYESIVKNIERVNFEKVYFLRDFVKLLVPVTETDPTQRFSKLLEVFSKLGIEDIKEQLFIQPYLSILAACAENLGQTKASYWLKDLLAERKQLLKNNSYWIKSFEKYLSLEKDYKKLLSNGQQFPFFDDLRFVLQKIDLST